MPLLSIRLKELSEDFIYHVFGNERIKETSHWIQIVKIFGNKIIVVSVK
jgi:hypothetical protein